MLEVTEHVPVEDYDVLRAAVGRLRPRVRIAVDDAGAGIANFSHIVELRPAYVKLDMSLTRAVDTDRTRMAMVVGLQQFAAESQCETIAEGVETQAELATLRRLGVHLAQGYLVGRPAPVETWSSTLGTASIGVAAVVPGSDSTKQTGGDARTMSRVMTGRPAAAIRRA